MLNGLKRFLSSLQLPQTLPEEKERDFEEFLERTKGPVRLSPTISGSGIHFQVGVLMEAESVKPGLFGYPRKVLHLFEPRQIETDSPYTGVPGQRKGFDEMIRTGTRFSDSPTDGHASFACFSRKETGRQA